MTKISYHMILTMTVIVGGMALAEQAQCPGKLTCSFEDVAVGNVPAGWHVAATHPEGPLATWQVIKDPSTTDDEKVLALTKTNHTSRSTYNLCWTDKVSFKNGTICVKLKANAGEIDQGGGPIWRVKDANNYYVCRANPLESNLRLYYVKNGERIKLANADLDIPLGQWHELEVTQQGKHIVCKLNGKALIEIDDDALNEAGGVGLWTKADAVTDFDAMSVEIMPEPQSQQANGQDAGSASAE